MLRWFTGSSATACDKELAMMKKSGFVENDNITLLAKGVLLRGEIRVEGTVRIDGRLEGDLHTAGTVVIGEDGVVQGTITAGIVISSGKIKATVRSHRTIAIAEDRSPRRRSACAGLFDGRWGKISRHVGHGRVVLGRGCAETPR
jgi:hypothetical protein